MTRARLALLLALATPTIARADDNSSDAVRLDDYERRLQARDETARRAQEKTLRELEDRLRTNTDPAQIYRDHLLYFGALTMQRRYRRLQAEAQKVLAAKLPPPPVGAPSLAETAHYYLVFVAHAYHDHDLVLREGDRFLAAHPSSVYYPTVRAYIEGALLEKRLEQQGARDAATVLRDLRPDERADPCRVVLVHASHRQWRDARKVLEALKPGQCPVHSDELQWFQVSFHTGDFPRAHQALERMRARDPDLHRGMATLENMFPVD